MMEAVVLPRRRNLGQIADTFDDEDLYVESSGEEGSGKLVFSLFNKMVKGNPLFTLLCPIFTTYFY